MIVGPVNHECLGFQFLFMGDAPIPAPAVGTELLPRARAQKESLRCLNGSDVVTVLFDVASEAFEDQRLALIQLSPL